MEICFEGVGQVAATFKVDSSKAVLPGMAVTLTADGTVGLGSAGNMPCGVLLGGVRGGAAAVQIRGAAQVSCSGETALAAGWQELVCDGQGGVKAASGGVSWLVLSVDTAANTAVVCM